MRPIEFNDLPRATRERFIQSLVSDAPVSAPICRRTVTPRSPAGWYVLLVFALVSLALLAIPRFGSNESPVEDRRYLGGYVVASALLGLALARLGKRRTLSGALPFVPGVYVFPLDLVDARTRELVLHSLTELVSAEPVHHQSGGAYTHSTLWLVFPTESFTFEMKSRERAETTLAKVQSARQTACSALQRNELHELAALDPFAEARARNFAASHDYGLLARNAPIWTRFVWAITIVSGLVLGVASWRLRNWQSDERAFARLRAKPDADLARSYVNGGGLHAADVKNIVLPRAQLLRAKAETDERRVDALEQFLKEHPESTVDAEARSAFAEAQHAQYLAQITVTGLRAFIKRWPSSPDTPAAKAKIRDLYRDTLADFRQHANVADKSIVPVVESLLGWAEERGAPVDVRFRRRSASTLASTDKLLMKNLLDDDGPAKGGNAEAAVHFGTNQDLAVREAILVAGLELGFRELFPADLLPLRLGASLEDTPGKGTLPIAGVVPAIVVDYEVGWTGATYVARDKQRRFVGLFVKLDVAIQVPKEPRVLSFSIKVEPPDNFPAEEKALRAPGALPSASKSDAVRADERVYDAMLLWGFVQAGPRLMTVFFEPRTAQARAPSF